MIWCQTHLSGYLDKLRLEEVGVGMGGGLSPIAASKSAHCTHPRHLLYTSHAPCYRSERQIYPVCCCTYSTPTSAEIYVYAHCTLCSAHYGLVFSWKQSFMWRDSRWKINCGQVWIAHCLSSEYLEFCAALHRNGLDLKYCVKYLECCEVSQKPKQFQSWVELRFWVFRDESKVDSI